MGTSKQITFVLILAGVISLIFFLSTFIKPEPTQVERPEVAPSLTALPENSPQTTELTKNCKASNASSFKDCIARVNNDKADKIEIIGLITCTGKSSCGFELKNISRPVSVYGSNATSGFKRLDTYNYNLITVDRSSGVKIYNLIFDENDKQSCTPVTDPGNCKPTVLISNSNNISVDNISVSHSKSKALEIYNSKKISITNSSFLNSYLFGVIFSSSSSQHGESPVLVSGHIENNLFQNTKSNGLVLYQTQATENDPIVVRGNTFINNHRENVYFLCGPNGQTGNQPCAGGQLYLANAVANVKIENNIIKDGGSTYGTGGIEFSNSNVKNVTVSGNEIYNNNMWGVYINPNPVDIDNVEIIKNKVYNNGTLSGYNGINIYIPHNVNVVESDNCFTPSCSP